MPDGQQTVGGPLAGVRVLEFSLLAAGPTCGRYLAEMGADVIKIEPPVGDPNRNTGAVVPNEAKIFQALNLGKRSLVLNLQTDEGRRIVHRLAKDADVLLCNYRFDVAERLGIDYETLSALNPRLVYSRITGFGVHTPEAANRPGGNRVVEAYSGLMVSGQNLDEDGMPLGNVAIPIVDYTAGFASTIAICAALYHREQSGRGQLLDVSLLRAAIAVQDREVMREPVSDVTLRDPWVKTVAEILKRGGSYKKTLEARRSKRSGATALRFYSAAYPAADGVIVLGAMTPGNREAARRVFGVTNDPTLTPPEDIDAPEYLASLKALRRQIADIVRTKTVAEWLQLLEEAGCPAAPVNYPERIADDPLVNAEGLIVDLTHRVTGPQRVSGPLFEMSATPTRVQRPAPALGEHSREVLIEAGFGGDEVNAFRDAGVVIEM